MSISCSVLFKHCLQGIPIGYLVLVWSKAYTLYLAIIHPKHDLYLFLLALILENTLFIMHTLISELSSLVYKLALLVNTLMITHHLNCFRSIVLEPLKQLSCVNKIREFFIFLPQADQYYSSSC